MFNIWNRRYTGSKYKLSDWIVNLINKNCKGESFCELFAGTGIISSKMLASKKTICINDFLYSNEIIYKAFLQNSPYSIENIEDAKNHFNDINATELEDNYISLNFGNKYFSYNDAKKIGYIREYIEESNYSDKEKCILIASLLYSLDKISNTVGHYEAYIKGKSIQDRFVFELIKPINTNTKNIIITRKNANLLVKEISPDIVYIDPPYNSRQYSRFYHVLENIAQWKKPKLSGVACKPPIENMSDYCRSTATEAFAQLISDLKCKYIVVSYNNTYNSKSSSSKNKISLEDIKKILSQKGIVSVYEKSHQFFNAGKTNFSDHKELIFITKVVN